MTAFKLRLVVGLKKQSLTGSQLAAVIHDMSDFHINPIIRGFIHTLN